MQFMYLRSNGTKKNPGRHPIGVIGVQKFEDCVQVAVATIHSEDRFEKSVGKEIVRAKMHAGNVVMIGTESPVNLHDVLPRGLAKRMNNKVNAIVVDPFTGKSRVFPTVSYEHQAETFKLLVEDEMTQGTWAKQNRDLLNFEDQRVKHIAKAIKIREEIRAEHGCAP